MDNMSKADKCYYALVEAAERKGDALMAERMFKRKRHQQFLAAQGTVAEREAKAAMASTADEDKWIAAETEWNIARAKADGLEIRFKEWQSRNATARAEAGLGGGMP